MAGGFPQRTIQKQPVGGAQKPSASQGACQGKVLKSPQFNYGINFPACNLFSHPRPLLQLVPILQVELFQKISLQFQGLAFVSGGLWRKGSLKSIPSTWRVGGVLWAAAHSQPPSSLVPFSGVSGSLSQLPAPQLLSTCYNPVLFPSSFLCCLGGCLFEKEHDCWA